MNYTPSPLTRRDFNRKLLGGLGAVAGGTLLEGRVSPRSASDSERPNIVFILSDQHAWKYTGFAGHPIVRTPNLDRLAQSGTVLANTYCTSPVCAPSRAGLMSGVYPSDCDSFCNATTWNGNAPAWPRLLRDAGYTTFGAGKMDTDARFDVGFEFEHEVSHGHVDAPDITAFFRRLLCGRMNERPAIRGMDREEVHRDAGLAAATVKFIRGRETRMQPWLAYCGFYHPHPPFVGRRDLFESYLLTADEPQVTAEELEALHPVYRQLRHFKDIATPINREAVRRARAAYYAMITEMDENVGAIWQAVADAGQLDRTIFVYTSDHGESLGNHGLWLKNNLYDDAARVPLVIAGPGVPAGVVRNQPVSHVDLAATVLDYGEIQPREAGRGRSLRPLLAGNTQAAPEWVLSENHSEGNCTGSFMVRKGDWKYIHFTWHDGLLFNLAEDPQELHNRFDDPAALGARNELQAILHRQYDPVQITERAFAVQQRRYERMLREVPRDEVLHAFARRIGRGQAEALLAKVRN